MSDPVLLRAVSRFVCLGGDCEDTCCQRWNISIDEAHYRDLGARMTVSEDQRLFALAFEPRPEAERTPAAFARIRLRPDDHLCPLLTPQKRCSVHERFGVAALPDVCAVYPRLARRVGERLEVYGALSCPEMVRQLVLPEDGADLVEGDPEALGRIPLVARASVEEADGIDEIRGGLLYLLDAERFSPRSRLFFLAWLAEEVLAGPGEGEGPGEGLGEGLATRLPDLATLTESVELVCADESLETLAEEMQGIGPTSVAAEVLFVEVLRLRAIVRPSFAPALDRVLAGYAAEGVSVQGGHEGGRGGRPSGDLLGAWMRRCRALPAPLAACLDGWLLRYARSFVLREIGLRREDFRSEIRQLILRIATLRLLCLSHPEIELGEASLARWFVEVVYQIARVVDHGRELEEWLLAGTEVVVPSAWELGELLAVAFGGAAD
ncbi:MAG TPA: flagellin lysine-N-methylase [Polyangia bacterium]|jgi:lysine-N-methylase|nr:flagellin lysine-N-methylase [Polyangia bacterium]